MGLLRSFDRVFDRLINGLAILAACLIVFMMLGVSAEVVRKLLTGRSLPWMTELVNYSLLWVTFLVAAWVLRQDGHVKMDLVLARLSVRPGHILGVITSVIGVAVCAVLVWYSAKVTISDFRSGAVSPIYLGIPIAAVNIIIPIGYFTLLFEFARQSWRCWKSCQQPPGEAPSE